MTKSIGCKTTLDIPNVSLDFSQSFGQFLVTLRILLVQAAVTLPLRLVLALFLPSFFCTAVGSSNHPARVVPALPCRCLHAFSRFRDFMRHFI
ncbi:hypothetical protein CKO31_07840 [Thiohalocapsa halophila]|uniref:Uncharacterized protein n=1 Tax=Thiohalocapsa halophila TaxID=69359 RepID=A0ABS1CGZ9_9GAMM|nr:hypothetical protein [Thiohalocapsa halophila]